MEYRRFRRGHDRKLGWETVNYKAIGRAIQSLDGMINIQWSE